MAGHSTWREPKDTIVKVRLDSEDLDRWRKLAVDAGFRTISDLIRSGVSELERQHRAWAYRLDHRPAYGSDGKPLNRQPPS